MLLVFLACIVVSCEKITNAKLVNSATTGKLSYKIVDDEGKGLSAVRVSVYKYISNSEGINFDSSTLIDTVRTDENGVAMFSELFPENYLLVTDSPMVNKVKYNTREFVQVVAGLEKEKVTKASEFSGSLRIVLTSNLDYRTLLSNTGVAAIPYDTQYISSDVKGYAERAVITGITNDQGLVVLKIPSNVPYYIMVYRLDKGIIDYWFDSYMLEKGASSLVKLYLSPVNQ